MPPEERLSEFMGSGAENAFAKKYPSNRDHPLRGADSWLVGKRMDDGAEGLWRIHDKLYDLSNFMDRHPGGKFWLETLKGTDITEAFETHHYNPSVVKMLPKFYVRDAQGRRNSPYTFHENGFYKTLKRKAWPILKKEGTGPTLRMRLMADFIASSFVVLLIVASIHHSHVAVMGAGVFLAWLLGIAHNFLHQSNNWRMHYLDFSGLSSQEWRITHAISHHLYTNTIYDWEIAALEPLINFLPEPNKSTTKKILAPFTSHFAMATSFHMELAKRIANVTLGNRPFRKENLLVLAELLILVIGSGSLWTGFMLWCNLLCTSSFCFAYIGLTGTHHHPDCYHEHDVFRAQPDWGLCQMDAVRDKKEVAGSLFLVSISFGDHTLHHLFPCVDHSKLPQLYPIFLETCKEFNQNYTFVTLGYLWTGMYRQMLSSTPNKNPPGYHGLEKPIIAPSVLKELEKAKQAKKGK